VNRYINEKEIIPALIRVAYGIAIVYMIFVGRIGKPAERMEFVIIGEAAIVAVFLLSILIPERWLPGSTILYVIDVGLICFGLIKLDGLNGWVAYLIPLLAVSGAVRFSTKSALAIVMCLSILVIGIAKFYGFSGSYYQIGLWICVLFLCWSIATQLSGQSEEQKYRMMYLDQEHMNTELEERIKDLEKKMQAQTIVDQVTGLKNFRYFRSRIEEELLRAQRKGYVFSLALIEVDDMPEFENMYGEAESRKAFQKISVILKEVFRNTDLVGRYRDNQFLVMMPETDARAALIPLMRFRSKLEKSTFGPDNRFDLHISMGVSCFPTDVKEVGGLLSLAYGALRRSQEKGKGMITLASSMFKKGPVG